MDTVYLYLCTKKKIFHFFIKDMFSVECELNRKQNCVVIGFGLEKRISDSFWFDASVILQHLYNIGASHKYSHNYTSCRTEKKPSSGK